MSMEPEVRYCTGEDGIRIAYCVGGEGPAHVVMIDPGASHVQLAWSHPILGLMLRLLSDHNKLVLFDPRGTGLSDRVYPSTPSEWVRDLDTVVKRVGIDEFGLTAVQAACRSAIAFAAHHPGQVRKLVLIDGFARVRDLLETAPVRAISAAGANDYEMATEAIATAVYGPGRIEGVTHGAYLRACVDQEWQPQSLRTNLDVASLMGQVASPTLVLRHKASKVYTSEMSRDLAARIPDARLVEVDGLWADDMEGFVSHVVAFVNDAERVRILAAQDQQRVTEAVATGASAVILFTDIVDSTALTERMGDGAFRDASRALDVGLRAAIREAGGVTVEAKTLGDGVLATFGSAAQAIEGARRCLALSAASELGLHIGLHAGDVIREEGNVFGGAVNIASRICGVSAPGEILVSDVVRGMARSSAGVVFEDRGEQEMKGVGEPVRVYAVRGQEGV